MNCCLYTLKSRICHSFGQRPRCFLERGHASCWCSQLHKLVQTSGNLSCFFFNLTLITGLEQMTCSSRKDVSRSLAWSRRPRMTRSSADTQILPGTLPFLTPVTPGTETLLLPNLPLQSTQSLTFTYCFLSGLCPTSCMKKYS